MRYLFSLLLFFVVCFFSNCGSKNSSLEQLTEVSEKRLTYLVYHQKGWAKIHAAEFCIDLDLDLPIDSIFEKENERFQDKNQYRIGIWNILSRKNTATQQWKDKIIEVAKDSSAEDQIYAIETLAKLQVSPEWFFTSSRPFLLNEDDIRLKTYTQWAMAIPMKINQKPKIDILINMLSSPKVEEKKIAAYALRELNYFPKNQWGTLADAALTEDINSSAKVDLLSTALFFCSDRGASEFKTLKKELLSYKSSMIKSDRFTVCKTMAEIGDRDDLPWLMDLVFMTNPIISIETLESPQEHSWNIDISAAAAYAVLMISKRLETLESKK